MAKIKFGAVITDSRGSIGGITFSKNRFGAVARRLTIPTGRLSNRATRVRSRQASFARRWGSVLTLVQRNAWITLAGLNPVTDVFGNAHALSGMQLYCRVNQVRAQVGLALVDAAPADQVVTGLVTATMEATTAPLVRVTFTVTPLAADHRLYIFATENLPPGIGNVAGRFRFVSFSGLAQASTYTFTGDYTARFGNPVSGRAIWFGVATERDGRGRVSVPIVSQVIVT